MIIWNQLRNGACLSYIIGCTKIRECIIVDPVGDPKKFLKYLEENRLSPSFIVETHTHDDHVSIAPELSKITGARIAMSEWLHKQREITKVPTETVQKNLTMDIKRYVKEGDKIAVGEIPIYFFHTPGHTKDSMCLYIEGKILTGDTLHIGGIAHERIDGYNPEELYESISKKIMSCGPDAIIYPGHDHTGSMNSSLGYEVAHNIYLKAKSKEEFLRMLADRSHATMAPKGRSAQEIFMASIAGELLSKHEGLKMDAESVLNAIVEDQCKVIDVRRPDEFMKGHIATSMNIPLSELPLRNDDIPRDKRVILVSNNTERSSIAALYLKEIANHPSLSILDNGITAWISASYPLE